MRVDYRSFLGKLWEAMPAAEYVAMASDPHVLGDPLLKTQHFIGASKWEKVSDTEVIGWHQLRVPHQRYTDESKSKVAVKGHAHGTNQHWYRKVDGTWKFAGLAVEIKWGEFDFDKVFVSGHETYSDEGKALEETQIATGVMADPAKLPGEEHSTSAALSDHSRTKEALKPAEPVDTPGKMMNGVETKTVTAGSSALENMSTGEQASMMTGIDANIEKMPTEGLVRA